MDPENELKSVAGTEGECGLFLRSKAKETLLVADLTNMPVDV